MVWVDTILQFDSNFVESAFPYIYQHFTSCSHPPKRIVCIILIYGFCEKICMNEISMVKLCNKTSIT